MPKIFKWGLILLGLPLLTLCVNHHYGYYGELNQIRDELNSLENIEVINIWGHEDMTLEEISVRLKVEGKGEIVLLGLSKDAFYYPISVPINEIEGYSFTTFYCNGGIGSSLDFGTYELGEVLNVKFNSVEDVLNNYDFIVEFIEGLEMSPSVNHFETSMSEFYLIIEKKESKDLDPIHNLNGLESKSEFAESLTWNRSDCVYIK
ncbi:hypothetical protein CRYO30217_03281 [Parvicella tangerina]|uniref:Uncharacterized protein n=2 Tax=Parvicella tangerina TaxID=2829795 RepID=A0A916NU13_9FLAO|nr:hypothetical protein CRYO30217_03281 [Parvicella tangerina]